MERIFAEVRTSFVDGETGNISIDAWKTMRDDEEGRVLGEYNPKEDKVTWRDGVSEEEKSDILVTEAIRELRLTKR